ncbi:MAG: hypothetical protein ACOCSE_05880, partial [Chitinivibrionales bacterium]
MNVIKWFQIILLFSVFCSGATRSVFIKSDTMVVISKGITRLGFDRFQDSENMIAEFYAEISALKELKGFLLKEEGYDVEKDAPLTGLFYGTAMFENAGVQRLKGEEGEPLRRDLLVKYPR